MSYTILLVDDEQDVRLALARCLRREGHELLHASSGHEALHLVGSRAIDMVITDQMMPEMTGLELISRLRAAHPQIIRIILTGYADFETVKAAINEGEIYRFLTKPWDDDDLRLTVRNAAHRLELERDNLSLTARVREQETRMRELERHFPGITRVERSLSGAILIEDA